jgi:hypothetical protein
MIVTSRVAYVLENGLASLYAYLVQHGRRWCASLELESCHLPSNSIVDRCAVDGDVLAGE